MLSSGTLPCRVAQRPANRSRRTGGYFKRLGPISCHFQSSPTSRKARLQEKASRRTRHEARSENVTDFKKGLHYTNTQEHPAIRQTMDKTSFFCLSLVSLITDMSVLIRSNMSFSTADPVVVAKRDQPWSPAHHRSERGSRRRRASRKSKDTRETIHTPSAARDQEARGGRAQHDVRCGSHVQLSAGQTLLQTIPNAG